MSFFFSNHAPAQIVRLNSGEASGEDLSVCRHRKAIGPLRASAAQEAAGPKPSFIRAVLRATSALAWVGYAGPQGAACPCGRPPQSRAGAIRRFRLVWQTGLRIACPAAPDTGRQAAALQGSQASDAALNRLLASSGQNSVTFCDSRLP